jgi:hypothetical protein
MKVTFHRQTGFYAMGSPLIVSSDGKKLFSLSEKGTKTLDLPVGTTIRGKLVSMKSPEYTLPNDKDELTLTFGNKRSRGLQTMMYFFLWFFFPGGLTIKVGEQDDGTE